MFSVARGRPATASLLFHDAPRHFSALDALVDRPGFPRSPLLAALAGALAFALIPALDQFQVPSRICRRDQPAGAALRKSVRL
jgi:hypothetical protein